MRLSLRSLPWPAGLAARWPDRNACQYCRSKPRCSGLRPPSLPRTKPMPQACRKAAPSYNATQKSTFMICHVATEHVAIQIDLILVGDLNANPTGEWGTPINAAAKAFQKRKGYKDTGIPLPSTRLYGGGTPRRSRPRQATACRDRHQRRAGQHPDKLAPQASRKRRALAILKRGEVQIDVFRRAVASDALRRLRPHAQGSSPRKVDLQHRADGSFVLQDCQGLKRFTFGAGRP